MKKDQTSKANKPSDEMRDEYRIDYSKSRPNRFASKANQERTVVILDPDIAKVFTTPESVNQILRALIAALPPNLKPKDASK